jgi:hypothetical protein
MFSNTRKTVALLALACAGLASAEEKKDAERPTPSGSWAKKDGHLRIDFADKGTMKVFPHGDTDSFVVVCSYTVARDGTIQAKITDLEGKDEVKEKAKNILPVGLEFRFGWKAKGEAATLEDLQGKDAEGLKAHMEGDFAKRKSD